MYTEVSGMDFVEISFEVKSVWFKVYINMIFDDGNICKTEQLQR